MIRGVDHLGLAVTNLDEGLGFWRDLLGLEATHTETVAEQGVKTAFLTLGDTSLELLEPTGPETPVGRFLAQRGPGFHHICLLVEDLEASLQRLRDQGARLIDETPRDGARGSRIAFVHPSSCGGVLVELKEQAPASTDRAEREGP